MTTTGLAKHQRLFAALEAEVVVVEEAAEVLEAHLLGCLTPATRHLILIGDHLQLRPSTAVYHLARCHGLDVSLFERLIAGGAEHVQLSRQRRMRPCISALLAPVYPALRDHPDTATFPPVPGMAVPLYFLSHAQPESHDGESNSRSNEHEAALSQALTQHLLRSGVAPSRITVLTTYCGQLVRLRKRFRAPGGEAGLDEVRLCSVDQFQGEESDIIILSLVRSNTLGSIGFLSVQNRMVVALSRARHGLYILGNGTLLSGRSALWRGVLEQLGATRAIGPALLVEAGGKRFEVAQPADFALCQLAGYPAKRAAANTNT
jgi:superfamily I DNA and/or RNA helicase